MTARLFLSLWFIWIIAICSSHVTDVHFDRTPLEIQILYAKRPIKPIKEFAFDAGSSNLIECTMSNKSSIIVWQLSLPSQDEATAPRIIPIYNGRSKVRSDFSNLFDIQTVKKNGQRTSVVTLLNVQSLHAGLYACMDADDDTFKQFFKVTVLVSKPHCSAHFSISQSTVQEFDSMQVTCNVSYVGNLLPVFRCQPSAAQLPQQFVHTTLIHHELNRTTITHSIVTLTHVHVIDVSRDVKGTSLTCSMEFTRGNISDDVQPLAYSFTWNYYIHNWNSDKTDTMSRVTPPLAVDLPTDWSLGVIEVATIVVATIAFLAVLVTFFITVCYRRRRRQLRSNKPDVLTSHSVDVRHNDDDFTQQTDLYAEVTVGRRRDPTVRPPPIAQAIYASIDHTATIR